MSSGAYSEEGAQVLNNLKAADDYNQWMVDLFRHHLRGRVLEVGAGTGNISRELLSCDHLTLSDVDTDFVLGLDKDFGSLPNVAVTEIDITEVEKCRSMGANFDTVVCLNVIEHIEDDLQAVRNLMELCAPGGRVILLVPQHRWLYGSFDKMVDHFRRYSRHDIQTLVRKAGGKSLETYSMNLLGILGWWFNAVLLQRKKMDSGQIKGFNLLVPFLRRFEALFPTTGLSVVEVFEAIDQKD